MFATPTSRGKRWKTCLLAAASASFLSFASTGGHAQSASQFRAFAGTWSGSGSLSHQNGLTERIRCEATYAPSGDDSLQQRLQCSSDSTSFDLVSNVQDQDGQLSGSWVEQTRSARGQFSGTLRRNLIEGTVQGPGFSASIVIALRGRRQTIGIRSAGSDISSLSMVLSRS
jgi:hypothetical protein